MEDRTADNPLAVRQMRTKKNEERRITTGVPNDDVGTPDLVLEIVNAIAFHDVSYCDVLNPAVYLSPTSNPFSTRQ
jgi:hypothetical protein